MVRYEYEFIEGVGFVVYDHEKQEFIATFNTEKESVDYCSPPAPEFDDIGMPLNGWVAVVTG